MTDLDQALAKHKRASLGHIPTPLELMENLSADLAPHQIYIKRDDCTGLAFGGNKVRQLEFYFGDALAQGADTVLITGAVQSNFVRTTAAAANKLGMSCHIQLEERVSRKDELYHHSGNVLLDHMLGATLHHYPKGEDEAGADARLHEIADDLRAQGHRPYVIPLAPGHAPTGALGYVVAAGEILAQLLPEAYHIDEIVVASGSGHTHTGLLYGLRALGSHIRVSGFCVRRDAVAQRQRIVDRCHEIADLLGMPNFVAPDDIHVFDTTLAPGYGMINDETRAAIMQVARREAIILDPVYTGKSFAGCLQRAAQATESTSFLFVHTGGTPAVFAYAKDVLDVNAGMISRP